MCTKLFHRLPYLLCLFQISYFAALQRIPLHSSSFSVCNDEHKKIDVICNSHLGGLGIEPKNLGNQLLVCGFIREFEPKGANKIIPDCIMSLCVGFSRRMLPCHCIERKYRKILPQLNIDEHRKKALIFVLMYKIEDVPDQKSESKKTILHYACKDGNLGLAKLLRKWGANLNAKNENGNNALHITCSTSSSVPMTIWLLDVCNIDIDAEREDKMTPFLCAAQKGKLAIAKLLKERGANVNAKNSDSKNALHLACRYSGSVPMVTWLLDECKIGLETKGCAQRTPFLFAAQEGQLAIAKLLKDRSVNINAKSKYGNNALHLACLFSGSVPMVTWLLDVCRIGLESKGCNQQTPFLCAAEQGQLAIVKLLRQRGANVNAKDKHGRNALYLAKYIGNKKKKMIDYLESQS